MPEPTPTQPMCPACHAPIDCMAIMPWGDGEQTLPFVPWICATCAALGILALATGHITIAPEALWQVVRERNPVLWQTIAAARARIRGETHA